MPKPLDYCKAFFVGASTERPHKTAAVLQGTAKLSYFEDAGMVK